MDVRTQRARPAFAFPTAEMIVCMLAIRTLPDHGAFAVRFPASSADGTVKSVAWLFFHRVPWFTSWFLSSYAPDARCARACSSGKAGTCSRCNRDGYGRDRMPDTSSSCGMRPTFRTRRPHISPCDLTVSYYFRQPKSFRLKEVFAHTRCASFFYRRSYAEPTMV